MVAMDAGAAPAPLVGPPRHRPGPPALHHPPTAPTRPTGSAHVSNSSCYSTCSGFHLLKISSIVTSASFYLAFTDQWCCCVNLCRYVELGGGFPVKKKVSYKLHPIRRALSCSTIWYLYGLKSLCYVTDFLVRSMVVQVQRSVGHFSAGKVVAHVLEAKMYLSRWDIQVALRSGCLVIYRKVINSRKRLRAHVGLDEGEVYGSTSTDLGVDSASPFQPAVVRFAAGFLGVQLLGSVPYNMMQKTQ
ncbi:uncharacterized protein [Triticum aestivum]|uniref:uncharacterized protein n=1 Tax=Triticum aestivum TaxID=4565 RepID=UPI001D011B31|nr:uncharacterized protein LOC123160982 [Triticum aestivum]